MRGGTTKQTPGKRKKKNKWQIRRTINVSTAAPIAGKIQLFGTTKILLQRLFNSLPTPKRKQTLQILQSGRNTRNQS